MAEPNIASLNAQEDIKIDEIRAIIDAQRDKMKLSLTVCAHCSLCAESCFLYTNTKDPKYMPSHKFIHSIGKLYKKRGKIDRAGLEEIGDIVFNRCVLCTRCYCPFGIDIPNMISIGRQICRTQGIFRKYDVK